MPLFPVKMAASKAINLRFFIATLSISEKVAFMIMGVSNEETRLNLAGTKTQFQRLILIIALKTIL